MPELISSQYEVQLSEEETQRYEEKHDELLIETAPEELDEVKKIVKSCMEDAVSLPVKLVAEIESGSSWYDCH